MYCAATGATTDISTKSGEPEKPDSPSLVSVETPGVTHSVGVGANDLASRSAAQGTVGDLTDAVLEKSDRAVAESEIGTAGVPADVSLGGRPEPAANGSRADCQVALPQGPPATGMMVLELNPSGTVVPAYDPLNIQKLLSAALLGSTSPTMIVLLVPSVMAAMLGGFWPPR